MLLDPVGGLARKVAPVSLIEEPQSRWIGIASIQRVGLWAAAFELIDDFRNRSAPIVSRLKASKRLDDSGASAAQRRPMKGSLIARQQE